MKKYILFYAIIINLLIVGEAMAGDLLSAILSPNPIELAVIVLVIGAIFGILAIVLGDLSLFQILSALGMVGLLTFVAIGMMSI